VNTGKYTEREYDDWGQVITVNAPAVPDPANPAVDVVYETSYTYDVLGRRLTVEDARGNATAYTYDVLGRQITVTNANNNTTQTFYDARSLRWKVVRPSGAWTESLYDDARRLATQTVYHDSTSDVTTYQYSVLGQVVQVDYPGGGRETFNYDQLGRRVSSGTLLTVAPEVVLTKSYVFDNNNRVVRMVAPGGYSYVSDYDDLGNLASSTDPASEVTTYAYDKDNRLVTKTDAVGVVTTNTYEWKTGRVASVLTELNATSADDITMAYSYDANGQPVTITDGRGYAWTKAYDALGRMVSLVTPNPGSGAYTHTIVYDGNGNITQTTDFKSVSHYYAYDALNRMSGHGASSAASDETYAYACCGAQLSGYTDTLGTASLSYDQLGRLVSFTDSQGYNVAYAYDALGRILALTPPQGANYRTEYEYNANGSVKLVRVYDAGTGADTSYIYDATSGKLTQRDFPAASGQNLRTAYSYDTAGRLQYETLQRVNHNSIPPSTVNLTRAAYVYDIGTYQRRTTREEQVYSGGWQPSWRMRYYWDGLSRQTRETRDDAGTQVYDVTQAYDKNGNRETYAKTVAAGQTANYGVSESLSYTYTAMNALASITDSLDASYTASVTCDANGNITAVNEMQIAPQQLIVFKTLCIPQSVYANVANLELMG
jgi:YD repeat-containing protein